MNVYVPPCSLARAQFYFSTLTQFSFLGNGASNSGLDLPTSVNLRQSLTEVAIKQPTQSLKLSLQVILGCMELTKLTITDTNPIARAFLS